MKADAILFDLDGTLWDSVDEIIKTWNNVLEKNNWPRPAITRTEQEGVMGLQMDVIAQKLFPMETQQRRMELIGQCIQEENDYLRDHGAKLFPEVEETLNALQKEHRLCIVSNCQKGYIEAFLTAHGLESYFFDHICFGETGNSKGENNKTIIARNGFQNPVYIGDTQGDRNAAKFAGIPFVFAAYGFGTVDGYEEKVETFAALKDLLC